MESRNRRRTSARTSEIFAPEGAEGREGGEAGREGAEGSDRAQASGEEAMTLATFPEMYERFLVGPLFRPWAELLVDRVEPGPGDRVLDVACGTGIVARLVRERLGNRVRVVGVDIGPQMLAVARAVSPDIDWREGNALTLPVKAGELFDVVFCHQGLQFIPDRAAAVKEMKRVLDAHGRIAVATWRPLDEAPFLRELHAIAEQRVGTVVDRRYSFGDAAALERLLRDAGFTDVKVDTLSRTIRFDDPSVFVRMNAMALVGMSTASSGMSDEERARVTDAIIQDSAEVQASYTDGRGLAFEIGANLASARMTRGARA
jgi:ubiquinone/menaquinone biosynthesis C-methylase UbiE